MKKEVKKRVINLENAIAPCSFSLTKEKIIYFDQVNKNEGLFKIKDEQGDTTICETNDNQGELSQDGELFSFEIVGAKTLIKQYNLEGRSNLINTLNGVFFEVQRDDGGELLTLGNYQSKTIIYRLDRSNKVSYYIPLTNIIFGSSIYLNGGFIYLGAININNKLSVLRLNSKGEVQLTWEIDIDSKERFISKILIYYNYIIVLIAGKKRCFVTINRVDGKTKEIELSSLGISNLMDFNIQDNKIYILSECKIYELECEALFFRQRKGFFSNREESQEKLLYGYYLFVMGLRNRIGHGFIFSVLPAAYLYFRIATSGNAGVDDNLSIILNLYIILSYFFSIFSGILALSNKENRIEYLLLIPEEEGIINKVILPLYLALISYSLLMILLFNKSNIILPLCIFLASFSLFLFINERCLSKIKGANNYMVVELLEDKSINMFNKIRTSINNLQMIHRDRICVSIEMNKKINISYIRRWNKSRRSILGSEADIELKDKVIIARIDFSKRNIKYSRISIIMDYICYLKFYGKVIKLEIDTYN